MQLWFPESMTEGRPSSRVRPDSPIVVATDAGSAVLCLEVDEATEHAPIIRSKLEDYSRSLRTGWHLLWVVTSEERLLGLRRLSNRETYHGLQGCSWVLLLGELWRSGWDTPAWPAGWRGEPRTLREVADDPLPRRCPTPIGSPGWVRVLGSRGGEEMDGLLG